MKLSEFISEAKTHIEGDGWVQRAFRTSTGQVCAISALERTAMAHLTENGPLLLRKAQRVLENKIIEIQGGEWVGANDVVPLYNDQQTTTQEDILALFEKAVAEAQEHGE